MTESRKRSAAETWRALEEMAEDAEEDAKIDAEMERILALSPGQVERELAEAGFDLEAVRARGEALGREAMAREAASLGAPAPAAREAGPSAVGREAGPSPAAREAGSSPVASVHPIAPRRRGLARTLLLLAAALAVGAALFLVGAFIWNSRPDNVAAPNPYPPDPPPQPAPPGK